MARRPTGQVIPPEGQQRGWAVRFTAYGKRRFVTLDRPEDGWGRERAEAELRHVLADVERGIWQPHRPAAPEPPKEQPSFHEFASEWLAARAPELAPKTIEDYRWALSYHLLPFFHDHLLSEITVEEVDRYKTAKLREGNLGASGINKTLKRLAQILDVAEEYGHLDRNPAAGRRRRVKEPKPRRSWVEPEQLIALLNACDPCLRPVIATLAGAGLRIGEAVALDWRDVNLATGTLTVGKAKTDAGTDRAVDLPLGLADELRALKARADHSAPSDPVFVNWRGARQTQRNVQARLKGAISNANEALAEAGIEPIGDRVSPHSLRRTYASLRGALRDDPVYIAEQLGHEDARFTLRVYAKAAKRRERLSGAYLAAFDQALGWAPMGPGEKAEKGRIGPEPPLQQQPAAAVAVTESAR
jgi:integrase